MSAKANINASETSLSAHPAQNVNDLLLVLEHQMKNLWSQYTYSLETNGASELTQNLKEKYFDIYRNYKNNKQWLEAINSD